MNFIKIKFNPTVRRLWLNDYGCLNDHMSETTFETLLPVEIDLLDHEYNVYRFESPNVNLKEGGIEGITIC